MQPSLEPRELFLGRAGLQRDRLGVDEKQLYAGVFRPLFTFAPSTQILSSSRESLAESAREWVKTALSRRHVHSRRSALDLPPLQLGKILQPLEYGDLLDEMLDDARS